MGSSTASIPTPDELACAAARLRGVAHRTPLLSLASMAHGRCRELWLKPECLQRAGSFKIRGAYNRIAMLSDRERRQGVVTFSSGNHGQGVALAAKLLACHATIVVPEDVLAPKADAIRGYGARLLKAGHTSEERKRVALDLVAREGRVLVPPFDDPAIIAGQSTVAQEILADCSELSVLLVPVGGGGLLAGSALAVAAAGRRVRVIGVEPESANCMTAALRAGAVVSVPASTSIADGLRPTRAGELTLGVAQANRVETVLVSEAAIKDAMRWLLWRAKLVVEPSGAVPIAALLEGKLDLQDECVAAILSGGNVDPSLLRDVIG
ncbi:MAG: threonine/serine dehydratase [Planctomycetota bacterium]